MRISKQRLKFHKMKWYSEWFPDLGLVELCVLDEAVLQGTGLWLVGTPWCGFISGA